MVFEVELEIPDEAQAVELATEFLTVHLEDERSILPIGEGLDLVLRAVSDVMNDAITSHADRIGARALSPGQSQWRPMDMYGAYPNATLPAMPGRRDDGSYTDDS